MDDCKRSNVLSLAQARFTYGITCDFNTHGKFPQPDIFLRDWGGKDIYKYIYTHTHAAAFLNSDMASKAEQKSSVSSTQQSPVPICHSLSRRGLQL